MAILNDQTTVDQADLLSYHDRRSIEAYEDVYTKSINYKDLDLRFIPHPLSRKLIPLEDTEAVKKALINLVLTEPGERPFNPDFGTPIAGMLFELNDINPGALEAQIERSIELFEPRARVIEIIVNKYIDQYAVDVVIKFYVVNVSNEIIEVRVKRTR
jgi:phage baseplate assembly protein W